MRWPIRSRTDVRGVLERNLIYDHVISQLRVKMRGCGTPCTLYKNVANTFYGLAPTNETKCYCWDEEKAQPDRSHFLCLGTGYLGGYQRYGYQEHVISTPSTVTKDNWISISGSSGSLFTISSNSERQGTILTERFALTRCEAFDRFLINDKTDPSLNRITYYYSTDDITWNEITTSTYTLNNLANKQGTFTLNKGTEYIRFKIIMLKRTVTSTSPEFNSIRFRYRNQKNLIDIDPTYPISAPSFLAAREQQQVEITEGPYGWATIRPLRWWVLPEVTVENFDIIQFLQGTFESEFYKVQQTTPHVHGPQLKVIHRDFTSAFLRDKHDVLKIIQYLS
jgi:hypothetical protein